METLTYDEARLQIKNGDIINMYKHRDTINYVFHAFVEFFTGSPIYHTAVAVWMKSPNGAERLMVVETNLLGGKRIVPLSIFVNGKHKLEVIHLPEEYKFSDMEEKMMERVGTQKYSPIDLLTIGIREFFGLPKKDLNGDVCSELVAKMWAFAGVPIKDTHISPGKLRSVLLNMGIKSGFYFK